MPRPPVGTVFWSADAQQFYQIGTAGAVSRLVGIESLHATETAAGIRYYDALGTRVPNPENLIPQSMKETFVGVERTVRSTSADVYDQKPSDNQFYKTWFTYRDPEGGIHLGYKNFRVGSTVDNEVEKAKLIAQIGDSLDIDPTSDEGGSGNIEPLITSIFHFIAE